MTENLTLQMDDYLPLRDVVFNTLREAILKGELKPGERLMEMHLATKLGVSRTPIREAIRMLEQEGLAVTIPRKGAQVAKMTEKDLQDVLEVRDALDALAVVCACERMTDAQFVELKEAMKAFENATHTDDVRKIVETDEAFHDVIYAAAANPKLENIISSAREQMYRYRYEYVKNPSVYAQLIAEHRAIIEGFNRRDVEYLKSIMHTHLSNQINAVRVVIREQV
ncbi:GntR family transcriptional regulator [Pseudobutyrivibrio sp.]|uniref:GntR family transcriptional regulator n=1 Tax=Pseudobutyrivibrio sp. TaxID=2014367 RepID=UPI0025EF3E71|nr:GntR family transcriptional regulator [Pseudobutyrivibrio sp.]MBR5650196.1 GntR family transcriptional regulator [Pseudobutyrivibrio sp.]